jgi:hypothetical protein
MIEAREIALRCQAISTKSTCPKSYLFLEFRNEARRRYANLHFVKHIDTRRTPDVA